MATQRVKLIYPDSLITRPVLSEVAIQFKVMANIRRAAVDDDNGWIICELEGEAQSIDEAMDWMAGLGVEVEGLGDVVES
ncbi:MAG: FeS-binding protein [Acidimicrobiaceae bacterium]|nr:FeS-binding protein [Acidimicrobiaceae bacterium]